MTPIAVLIAQAQAAAINRAAKTILADIRNLQLQLSANQTENSGLLEDATKTAPRTKIEEDITIIGCDWLPAFCLVQIQALKVTRDKLQAEIAQIRGNESHAIPTKLLTRKREAEKRREELIQAREDLRTELASIRTESLLEKEELREYIRRNK
jgi:hypothetical protein